MIALDLPKLAVIVAAVLVVMFMLKLSKKVIGITIAAGIALLALKYFGVI